MSIPQKKNNELLPRKKQTGSGRNQFATDREKKKKLK